MPSKPNGSGNNGGEGDPVNPKGVGGGVPEPAKTRPGFRGVALGAIRLFRSVCSWPGRWLSANKNRILFECCILGGCILGVVLLVYVGQLVNRPLIPDLAGYVIATPTPPIPVYSPHIPVISDPDSGEALPALLTSLPDSPDSISSSINNQSYSGPWGARSSIEIPYGEPAGLVPVPAVPSESKRAAEKQNFDVAKKIINESNKKIKAHNLEVMTYRRANLLYLLTNFFALSLLIYLIVRPQISVWSVYAASIPEKGLLLRETDQVMTALVTMLRQRARWARVSSLLVLALLLICLVSGLAFFVFAGAIERSSSVPSSEPSYNQLRLSTRSSLPREHDDDRTRDQPIGTLSEKQMDDILARLARFTHELRTVHCG